MKQIFMIGKVNLKNKIMSPVFLKANLSIKTSQTKDSFSQILRNHKSRWKKIFEMHNLDRDKPRKIDKQRRKKLIR